MDKADIAQDYIDWRMEQALAARQRAAANRQAADADECNECEVSGEGAPATVSYMPRDVTRIEVTFFSILLCKKYQESFHESQLQFAFLTHFLPSLKVSYFSQCIYFFNICSMKFPEVSVDLRFCQVPYFPQEFCISLLGFQSVDVFLGGFDHKLNDSGCYKQYARSPGQASAVREESASSTATTQERYEHQGCIQPAVQTRLSCEKANGITNFEFHLSLCALHFFTHKSASFKRQYFKCRNDSVDHDLFFNNFFDSQPFTIKEYPFSRFSIRNAPQKLLHFFWRDVLGRRILWLGRLKWTRRDMGNRNIFYSDLPHFQFLRRNGLQIDVWLSAHKFNAQNCGLHALVLRLEAEGIDGVFLIPVRLIRDEMHHCPFSAFRPHFSSYFQFLASWLSTVSSSRYWLMQLFGQTISPKHNIARMYSPNAVGGYAPKVWIPELGRLYAE